MTERVDFGHGIHVIHISNMASTTYCDNELVKSFYGELAWMDAERLANDLMFERMYA